jgi:hypothetical protein
MLINGYNWKSIFLYDLFKKHAFFSELQLEMFNLWMQAELCKVGSTLNEQNRHRIDSMFYDICSNSGTFMKHFHNLFVFFCNSNESCHWSVKIERFLLCRKFHYRLTGLSAVRTFQIVLWT